jgi:hypothetical protein
MNRFSKHHELDYTFSNLSSVRIVIKEKLSDESYDEKFSGKTFQPNGEVIEESFISGELEAILRDFQDRLSAFVDYSSYFDDCNIAPHPDDSAPRAVYSATTTLDL